MGSSDPDTAAKMIALPGGSMKYGVIVIFCALSASAYAAPTLCLADEAKVFNCTAGKKVISVCSTKDLAADRGYLQYRFGSPGKVELTIPADRSVLPTNSALSGTLVFSGGGGDYLRFQAGDYQYVVYTAIGKGWGEKDGVAIEKDGKRRAHVSCTNEPESQLGAAFSTKAGLKQDTGDFDLP
jgi:hypothetical protein